MKTLTYNSEKQEWVESDNGLDPEVPSNDWHLKVLRKKRNALLQETDIYALSDVTMSDAMKTYRQQLRDAPSGLDTVEKVNAYTFPTEVLK